jgi:hypothetical protein
LEEDAEGVDEDAIYKEEYEAEKYLEEQASALSVDEDTYYKEKCEAEYENYLQEKADTLSVDEDTCYKKECEAEIYLEEQATVCLSAVKSLLNKSTK